LSFRSSGENNNAVDMKKVKIGKASIDDISFQECVATIEGHIRERRKTYVVTPNVDHIVKLESDPEFVQCYNSAGLVVADGAPLIFASRLLGTPLKERIAGSDLFCALCERSAQHKYSLFFLGGMDGVATTAMDVLRQQYPGINVVGTYSPPFGFDKNQQENEKIISLINDQKPDILFVGVGAPKQEKWIYHNLRHLDVHVALGTGAAFDFAAKSIKRAPRSFRNLHMEWFWRFLHEPTRLFKRYFVDSAEFLPILFRQMRQARS
jgi:N-acetylglucosaminyldiphosphoundecaprenol N-acetyl-beta-D-mannosaminyltransferase